MEMNSEETRRLTNSQILSNVAIALIVASAAFLSFALEARELSRLFWSLLGIGISILVLSMILGGRGIARISQPGGLFNYQAVTCILGFLILTGSITVVGEPTKDETSAAILKLASEVSAAARSMEAVVQSQVQSRGDIQSTSETIEGLQSVVDDLDRRLSKLEPASD